MIWKANRRINMQLLRNTYAEHTLMPHFGSGEKASVETGGWATGWAATESACMTYDTSNCFITFQEKTEDLILKCSCRFVLNFDPNCVGISHIIEKTLRNAENLKKITKAV